MTGRPDPEAGKPLTPKEQQVCEYLCLGWSNKEIAQVLHLSPRTVEDHRMHVMRKKTVRNSVELVRVVYGLDDVDKAGEVVAQ